MSVALRCLVDIENHLLEKATSGPLLKRNELSISVKIRICRKSYFEKYTACYPFLYFSTPKLSPCFLQLGKVV